jgi:lysophospholipase L1-like esterase
MKFTLLVFLLFVPFLQQAKEPLALAGPAAGVGVQRAKDGPVRIGSRRKLFVDKTTARPDGAGLVAFFSGASPADPPTRIVVLGDSITRGVRLGVTEEDTFASMLQRDLRSAGRAIEVVNQGIGGERTDQALKRLESDVLARRPKVVVVMYGTNDSYVDKGQVESRITAQQFEDNLETIVQTLQRQHIKVVLMTEPRWGRAAAANGAGEHPNLRLQQFMQRTRKLANAANLPLVDHFLHWTEAEKRGTDIGSWTTDQCHPNAAGHRQLADQLLAVMESLLN